MRPFYKSVSMATARARWLPSAESVFGMAVTSLLSVVLLSSCSTNGTQAKLQSQQSQAPLLWPPPPDEPRIAYVQSIHGPADVGIRRSAIARFTRWVVGSDKAREEFAKPFGIALDENDNLCVADTGANAILYWDAIRKKWHRFEKVGKNFYFASPVAVAKRNGIFYVADSGLGRIVAFDEDAKLRFHITNNLERPSGLTVSGEKLFVADSQRHCIVIYDLSGNYISEFGRRGSARAEFNFPTHISSDSEGNLLVTDSMNSRVQLLDQNGNFKSQIGSAGDSPGEFSRPKGVATDGFGHIYIVDALFDNMQIFNRDGRLLLNFAQAGSAPGQFWLPNGVAISRSNEVFVADSYNRRVQRFRYVGKP
jgi:sugar lactone lactonase YvrE